MQDNVQVEGNMNRGIMTAIIVLPGTALVLVPAIILAISARSPLWDQLLAPHQFLFWLALLPAGAGLGLAVWTVSLFVKFGDGTPAPWDPPQKLVIRGPYRHVRNPMITGALLILLAEAMLFGSWPIAFWMGIFFMGNALYFPLFEEKGLEKRFGDDYRFYKKNVPRWIPRMRPWDPDKNEL
jgi:protein-S-isoprenylcysteine O-methyltransferase Ste14